MIAVARWPRRPNAHRMGAATGSLSWDARILCAMVFLWQFPHVMTIAWMYRSDYDRAGYAVLPAGERGTTLMIWQMMAPLILLLPLRGGRRRGLRGAALSGRALLLGAWFVYRAERLAVQRSNATARQVLLASIVYLPLLFAFLIAGCRRI
jgi:heme o synthase